MRSVEVVSLTRLTDADRARIAAVDPAVNLTDAGDWFDGEIAEQWPEQTARGYLGKASAAARSEAERDAVLAKAEIVLGGFPYLLDLRARAPNLKWFHQRNAGANNLWRGDLWRCDAAVTTSRGYVMVRPIAEYAAAGLLYMARDFAQAEIDRGRAAFDRKAYRPVLLAGKTVCIVGAGGIGQEAGRLLAGLGMTVLGVRRSAGSKPLPDGFAEMHGADGLLDVLARSDAAVVCCQLTRETEGLMGAAAFAALRPGAMLVNIARGEIVDEDALLDALDSGHLRAAVLDVYAGEFDGPPQERLRRHPRVLITPHNSGRADADLNLGIDAFCDNLRAYIDGRPLKNVIDWDRGY